MPAKARRRLVCLALAISLIPLVAVRAQEDGSVRDGGRPLFGRVVDSEGRPLEGVQVWRPATVQERTGRAEYLPAAVTSADGAFQIQNPKPAESLSACREGWLHEEVRVSPNGSPVEIRLQPAARLAGRVVDGRGEPVPGITILTQLAGWAPGDVILMPPASCPGHPRLRYAQTDPDGRFVLEGLVQGWFQIIVSASRDPLFARGQALVGANGPELEIAIPGRLVSLAGRIEDANGKPVEGAEVSLAGALPPAQVRTGADGTYRFRVLSGPRALQVSHPNLGWIDREVRIGDAPVRLDLRMPAATLVEGHVLARDGSPVAGLWMTVDGRSIEVDAEGRFRFRVPQGEHKVRAETVDWPQVEKTILASGDRMELSLEMSRPATIHGRITGLPPWERGTVELKDAPPKWFGPTYADQDGSFHLDSVAPGSWTLVARDANGRTVQRRVQIEEGQEVTIEELYFPPLPEVRGRILDPEGRPFGYAHLSFVKGELTVPGDVDDSGRFTARLADGTWAVKAEFQGLGPAATSVTMAGAPLEIPDLRLVRTVAFSGYVRGLAPGEIAQVEATSEDGLWQRFVNADQENRFTIPDLWPGTWTVTARSRERQTSTLVRILPQDNMVQADITFQGE